MVQDANAVVYAYLMEKGYKDIASKFKLKAEKDASGTKQQSANVSQGSDLLQFVKNAGLNVNTVAANHVLYYGMSTVDSGYYIDSYDRLVDWICNSLDSLKTELYLVVFPVFAHVYLELIRKGNVKAALEFYRKCSGQHEVLHSFELKKLSLVTQLEHTKTNPYVQELKSGKKVVVSMSLLAFELLHHFLYKEEHFFILFMLNQYVSLRIVRKKPESVDIQLSNVPRDIENVIKRNKVKDEDLHSILQKEQLVEQVIPMKWGVIPQSHELAKQMNDHESLNGDSGENVPHCAGPVPNRIDAFNLMVNEKLLLRQSDAQKVQQFNDLRLQAKLDKNTLPSALCFTFTNEDKELNTIEFSMDASTVIAGFDHGGIKIWRNDNSPVGTPAGEAANTANDDHRPIELTGHSGPVYGTSISPDNRFLLSASGDSTVRLWSLAAQSNVVSYKRAHNHYPIWDVQFSPIAGYYFASASLDRTARLWSTDRIEPLRIFAGHLSDVECVQFHPNSNYIATGSADRSVRLWDIQSGRCIRIFHAHFDSVQALAFSPDGRYLASGGNDTFINIWDIANGKRIDTLMGHSKSVNTLTFGQSGHLLASGGDDYTVRLWDIHASQNINTDKRRKTMEEYQSIANEIKNNPKVTQSPMSNGLLRTLYTKDTPIYNLAFTKANLLLAGGCYRSTSC